MIRERSAIGLLLGGQALKPDSMLRFNVPQPTPGQGDVSFSLACDLLAGMASTSGGFITLDLNVDAPVLNEPGQQIGGERLIPSSQARANQAAKEPNGAFGILALSLFVGRRWVVAGHGLLLRWDGVGVSQESAACSWSACFFTRKWR
jgi:hypothetical protein